MRTLQGRLSICAAEGGFRLPGILILALVATLFSITRVGAQNDFRFDTFIGYGNTVREGNWFPLVVEIENGGAGFTGRIEITSGSFTDAEVRGTTVELPPGTTKRLSIPVFSHGGRMNRWSVRIVDEDGRVRAANENLNPFNIAADTPIFGAVAESPSGAPSFPRIAGDRPEYQPRVEVISRTTFPVGVLELEGLDGLYVNSARLIDFTPPQIDALAAWFEAGGHLILAIDQPSDLQVAPWLRRFLPLVPDRVDNAQVGDAFFKFMSTRVDRLPTDDPRHQKWNAQLDTLESHWSMTRDELMQAAFVSAPPADALSSIGLAEAEVPLAAGFQRSGEMLLSFGDKPAIIRSTTGRSTMTMLLFNPEREPFRSWEHRDQFWAKLLGVASKRFTMQQFGYEQAYSTDALFGAMIDSRQVRKLPIRWLIALLILYLIAIGPLDHFVLKKLNRQILTWLTFPAYVALFSCGIYWIGYKLRAGDSEVTAMHVVDVTPGVYDARLRGRSYLSVYSPVNETYPFAMEDRVSTFRNETGGSLAGGLSNDSQIEQMPDGFRAGAFVPVWTSQLYVNDWVDEATPPLNVTMRSEGGSFALSITNRLSTAVTDAKLVYRGRVVDLGRVENGESASANIRRGDGRALGQLLAPQMGLFTQTVQQRGQGFGDTSAGRLTPSLDNALAISFISRSGRLRPDDTGGFSVLPAEGNNNQWRQVFTAPEGFDLSRDAVEGHAIVFAMVENHSPVPSAEQFTPRRRMDYTVFRMVIPITE